MTAGSDSKLLLYTAKVCPYAARAELALELAGLDYDVFEVDLMNKPSWYADKINAASKVPVLVSTRDNVEFKLPESLVIVEYIHDLSGRIFASDDAQHRAVSRYIVQRYEQLVQPHYYAAAINSQSESVGALLEGLKQFSALLGTFDPATRGGAYIQGGTRFAYADLGVAPFVARILSVSREGLLPKTDAPAVHEAFASDPALARLNEWWSAVQTEPAWNKVWDEAKYLAPFKRRLASLNK
ncbi:hypothetical protein PANT_26d00083 [Moesziomyces antarcticus T-34]|uniref:GST N-terminal domain-containing protein n=1 Tax=Pseudozyma antarctica (strain T-34) TaxID=1151754 RepID=M9M873_PSEA3|nr:hypothetical protein PANT_26d00083 [Moesziomyces antarcticus T-34]